MKVKESGQFENSPPGNHIARCYGVIDLGTQSHSFQGESWSQRDVRISFELPNELMTGIYNQESKGKPFSVGCTVKQSLHSKARLRALLKGWRGRDFTPEELKGFDLKSIIGKACRVNLVASPDGQFTNIEGISPLGKLKDAGGKMVLEPCPKQVNKSVYFCLEPDEFDVAMLGQLSEKTQEKIRKSPEWQALASREKQPEAPEEPAEGEAAADSDVAF